MHLLKNFTGSEKSDIQLEVAAGKLAFDIFVESGVNKTTFDNAKISINVGTRNGVKPLINKMPLLLAMEMSALGEGFFIKNNQSLKGCVDLSEFGAFGVPDGYVSLNVEGLPADSLINIHAVDLPINTSIGKVVEEILIQGTRELVVNNKTELFMPASNGISGIDEITVSYPSKSVTYTMAELEIINMGKNDLLSAQEKEIDVMAVTVDDGEGVITLGYQRLVSLDISEAFAVKFRTFDDTTVKVYTTHNQQF